jgi:dihydropteroate synthase
VTGADKPPDQGGPAESLAVITWAVIKGVRVVRARDVRASKRACLMTEAVLHPDLLPVER